MSVKSTNYRFVREYLPEETQITVKNNINKIENISEKLIELKSVIQEKNWNASLFEVINPRFEGIVKGKPYEYPFIALHGLKKDIISRDEFFLIHSYYALRTAFNKKEITVYSILDEEGSIRPETEKLLRTCLLRQDLCPKFSLKFTSESGLTYQPLLFSEEKFQKFISLLKTKNNSHEMILFSTPELDVCKNRKKPDVAEVIRHFAKFKFFYNDKEQLMPSLKVYEIFLKVLHPFSQDAQLIPRFGLTPNEQQGKRAIGHFDVFTPSPFCFEDKVDGHPAPGLQSVYHELFYHAVIVFGMTPEIRGALYKMAEELRGFEGGDRHHISDQIFDSAFHMFLGEYVHMDPHFDKRIEKFKDDLVEDIALDSEFDAITEKFYALVDTWARNLQRVV